MAYIGGYSYAAPAPQGYVNPPPHPFGAPPPQPYSQPVPQPYGAPQAQPYQAPLPQAYGAPPPQAYGSSMYAAPAPHMIVPDVNLEALPGVVIKETTQVVDALMAAVGGPYEAANRYHVKAMQMGKTVAKDHGERGTWKPSSAEIDSLPPLFYVEEESDCCLRATLAAVGGLNLRALTLHFYINGQERYIVDRPCKCGGCCCCPLEMTLYHKEQGMYGMVVEDYDNYCSQFCNGCCRCISRHKVMLGTSRQSLVHKYSLVNAACCCGRVNNCCGATCCKPLFFIDVIEPHGRLAVAAQKTYGGGEGCADCCRCTFDFNNYVMPFPDKATHAERMLLLTGLLSVEYAYHSRTGGEGGGDDGNNS